MGARRVVGGAGGVLFGLGAAVGLRIALAAPWQVVAFFAALFCLAGARIGSRTRPSIGEHKFFLRITPLLGAMGGFFLGIALVHGVPAKGDFGWPVVACCALLAGLGFALPLVAMFRFVSVACRRCGGPARLNTDSTFVRKVFAAYHYRCCSCGHTEDADFSRG